MTNSRKGSPGPRSGGVGLEAGGFAGEVSVLRPGDDRRQIAVVDVARARVADALAARDFHRRGFHVKDGEARHVRIAGGIARVVVDERLPERRELDLAAGMLRAVGEQLLARDLAAIV